MDILVLGATTLRTVSLPVVNISNMEAVRISEVGATLAPLTMWF
jgi:hypothetical protein